MTANVATVDTKVLGNDQSAKHARRLFRRTAFGFALFGALAGAAYIGYQYWTVGRFVEGTDDAYVKADYSTIAPKVSGYVAQVLVADNQHVKAGQVLARIDDRDYRTTLEQIKAKVAATRDAIGSLDAELKLQHAVIDQARANIDAGKAALKLARDDFRRYADLAKTHYVAAQRLQQAQTRVSEQTAAVQRDRAGLVAAERKIGVLDTQRVQAQSTVDQAKAAEHQAELNLGYTTIISPIDGTVGARTLRVGQYVQAGTPLMAVVPLKRVFVVANFKETQLTNVRPGQPVTVEVDTFPGVVVKGHVDSLSPASGLEFALLPPDNATGNFTKVVQRVPVKIVLDADNPLMGLLRPGMSVEPSIDTRSVALAVRDKVAPVMGQAVASQVAQR